MIRRNRQQLVQLYVASDILAMVLAFVLSYWLRFHSGLLAAPKGIPPFRKYLIVLPVLILLHLLYFSYQEFYRVKLRRNRLDDLFLVIINCGLTSLGVLFAFSYLKSYRLVDFEVSHVYLLVYFAVSAAAIFNIRLVVFRLFRGLIFRKNGFSQVLIAGEGQLATLTAENLRKYGHFGLEVVGFLGSRPGPEVVGGYGELEAVVKQRGITDLFIALPLRDYDRIMELIGIANRLYIDIRLVPDLLQMASLKAGMEHLEGIPIIHLGDIPLEGWRAILKRAFDLVFSSLVLLLISPFLALVALLVKMQSRGPVFITQPRVGLDGSVFKMIKFRTMVPDAERETGPIWSPRGDPRITPLGRVLRKLSIDELPQFINVLRGDMSLVGPRPERPQLVDKFKDSIPRYLMRHRVKAGITGWAQVHGLRGNTPLDKRIEFDIYYIQNWSFKLDLEIIFRTLFRFKFIDWNN